MAQRIPIPKILGIDWWWLFIAGLFEAYSRYLLHIPDWVPSISGVWVFLQSGWLLKADPRSRAIYLYASGSALAFMLAIPWVNARVPHLLTETLGLCIAVLWIAAMFVFRSEMIRHFKQTEPRGIELGPFMTFFFNVFYFQYWFHQIYVEQNEPDLRLTGTM